MEWNKTYGGIYDEHAKSMIYTSDGGYAMAGPSHSLGAGNWDFWIVKTDEKGNNQWNNTYGSTGYEWANSIIQTNDEGYAMVGYKTNLIGVFPDFWLVKTEVESGLAWIDTTADTITLYRGATDIHWNYVKVQIWEIKENP